MNSTVRCHPSIPSVSYFGRKSRRAFVLRWLTAFMLAWTFAPAAVARANPSTEAAQNDVAGSAASSSVNPAVAPDETPQWEPYAVTLDDTTRWEPYDGTVRFSITGLDGHGEPPLVEACFRWKLTGESYHCGQTL